MNGDHFKNGFLCTRDNAENEMWADDATFVVWQLNVYVKEIC